MNAPDHWNHRLAGAAIVLALVAAPAAADLDTGLSHFRSGKYLEAAGEFQQLVDDNPDYSYGYHLLGACFLQMKKYADAEKNILKAIELDGDKFEFHYNLANAYVAQGKHDKVVKTLNNAEGLAPNEQKANVYRIRGHALAAQKKWGEAIEDLEKSGAGNSDPATSAQLGKAYYAVGEYDSSIKWLRKSLAAKDSADEHSLLVEAMINIAAKSAGEDAKKQKYGEAMAEAEKFQAKAPASTDAKYLVGRTALGAGSFDKSIAAFKAVVQANPKHCNAVANLGKAYVAKDDRANALSTLEDATKCDAKMGLAWENMGFVHQKNASGSKDFAVQQANYKKAIDSYKKAASIKPSASIQKAIADCEQNLRISQENQGIASAEAEQDAAIQAEQERLAAEEAKRKAWEAKRQGQ